MRRMNRALKKMKGMVLVAGLSMTLAAGAHESCGQPTGKTGTVAIPVRTAPNSDQDQTWTAHWIQAPWSTERDGAESDGSRPMPVFRREFVVRAKVVKATLRIAGLGQYEVRIGSKGEMRLVAPGGLHQAWTNYRKTVTYESYDVTKMLTPGPHALGVMLGNGVYNVQKTKGRFTKFEGSFGPPKLRSEE